MVHVILIYPLVVSHNYGTQWKITMLKRKTTYCINKLNGPSIP